MGATQDSRANRDRRPMLLATFTFLLLIVVAAAFAHNTYELHALRNEVIGLRSRVQALQKEEIPERPHLLEIPNVDWLELPQDRVERSTNELDEGCANCAREIRLLKTYYQHVQYQCLHKKTAHLIPSPEYGRQPMDLGGRGPIQWTATVNASRQYAYVHNQLFNITDGALTLRVSGKYMLNLHLTIAGRTSDSRHQRNVHCAFITEVEKHGAPEQRSLLMSNIQTQIEKGRFVEYDIDRTVHYPYDGSQQTGIFLLEAGDVIRVKPGTHSSYCRLELAPAKAHFSAMLIQEHISGHLPAAFDRQ